MNLYLLRHADAETIADTDDARPLSEKGRAQARKVGEFCKRHGIAVSSILTSPLPRAQQTAELVNAALGAELTTVPWLESGMRAPAAIAELQKLPGHRAIMIVGHEPDFSALAAHLLGLPVGENINIRKASLTLLEMDLVERGAARLDFSVPCRLM